MAPCISVASLKGDCFLGRTMFQAFGFHGPELSPLGDVMVDVGLVGLAFALLTGTSVKRQEILTLVTLVVATVALRVLMQPIPNVQPVTLCVLLVGSQLGARRGMAFAVMVTLLSNMIIGDGWWTLFQAAGWSAVALLGSRLELGSTDSFRYGTLYAASFGSAFLFGAIASLSILEPGMGLVDFAIYLAQGWPFDLLHALGNITFAAWFGLFVFRSLEADMSLEAIEQSVVEGHVTEG